MDIINIYVEDIAGNRQHLEIPTEINLNLMEVLKASEYPYKAPAEVWLYAPPAI
jgi:hypothetical protein